MNTGQVERVGGMIGADLKGVETKEICVVSVQVPLHASEIATHLPEKDQEVIVLVI